MPEVHAILSASSSKRWLNCTPSARLEQNFPNESSVYAEEGTAAHALGEYKLRKYLHERVQRPASEFDSEEITRIWMTRQSFDTQRRPATARSSRSCMPVSGKNSMAASRMQTWQCCLSWHSGAAAMKNR